MTFQQYLAKRKITAHAASVELGVSSSVCYYWFSGRYNPSFRWRLAIEDWSNGAVSVKDWA